MTRRKLWLLLPRPTRLETSMADDFDVTVMDRHDNPHVLHEGGVPWHEAPVPRRWHRCKRQTSGALDNRWIERCACGAIRVAPGLFAKAGRWMERNSRRRQEKAA